MKLPLILGVDGGGSKTRALVADAQLNVLGSAAAGASNINTVGVTAATAALGAAIDAALVAAQAVPGAIAAACLACAGAQSPLVRAELEAWFLSRQITERFVVVADVEPVLAAGTPEGWGIALIAGTGAVGFGRGPTGPTLQVSGWGPLLGDEGSGYDLARQALRLATQTADGRADAHAVLQAILAFWRLPEPRALIDQLYRKPIAPAEIAELTRPILALAAAGDPYARGLLDTTAHELVRVAQTLARRLDLPGAPVALAGGLLLAEPYLRERIAAELGPAWGPFACVEDPARGTLILARRALGQ
jgi:N-acetylglucosamine kinase-like BadF-type ATPase